MYYVTIVFYTKKQKMEDALTYTGGGGPDGGTVVTRLPDDQRVVGSNSTSRLRSCIMHFI